MSDNVIELDPQEHNTSPALYQHCVTIFRAMKEQTYEAAEGLVYEGYLTRLFNEKGFSTPYYTHVMSKLQSMDCVRQIRRGGGSSPSVWLLLQEPTEELFRSVADEKPKTGPSSKMEMMSQQIRDLSRRVSDLEDAYGVMMSRLDEVQPQVFISNEELEDNDADNV